MQPVLTGTYTRTDRECYKQDRLRRPVRRLTLHGIPLRPGPGGALVLVPVRLVHVRDLRNQRIIRVWVTQQGADGQQHLGNSQSGAPLVLEDVEANAPVAVDVWMEHLGAECHLWWFERIIRREVDGN